MDCKLAIAIMIFTFVIAVALVVYGIRTGNWLLVVSSVIGYAVVLYSFVPACLNGT